MTTEERKEEVALEAPEVRAAHQLLMRAVDTYLVAANAERYWDLRRLGNVVEKWEYVCGRGVEVEVVRCFRETAAETVTSWLRSLGAHIEDGEWPRAFRLLRSAQQTLCDYLELLGVEIPPEEEEVPEAPSATEEGEPEVVVEEQAAPEPVEGGTLLAELGLPIRIHGIVFRSLKDELGRRPFVEDLLRIYAEEGEEGIHAISGIGPKSCEKILAALREHGFLPGEEPGKRELIRTFVRSE